MKTKNILLYLISIYSLTASTAHALTWTSNVVTSPSCSYSSMLNDSSGNLILGCTDSAGQYDIFSSSDDGTTWSSISANSFTTPVQMIADSDGVFHQTLVWSTRLNTQAPASKH